MMPATTADRPSKGGAASVGPAFFIYGPTLFAEAERQGLTPANSAVKRINNFSGSNKMLTETMGGFITIPIANGSDKHGRRR